MLNETQITAAHAAARVDIPAGVRVAYDIERHGSWYRSARFFNEAEARQYVRQCESHSHGFKADSRVVPVYV